MFTTIPKMDRDPTKLLSVEPQTAPLLGGKYSRSVKLTSHYFSVPRLIMLGDLTHVTPAPSWHIAKHEHLRFCSVSIYAVK